MTTADLPALASPGSRPLRNSKQEKYCRLRAALQPRAQAYREAGWSDRSDDSAYSHACRLERRPGVRDRIAYLSRQAELMIAVKREKIEAQLWAITEGNIADFFEPYDAVKRDHTGQPEHTDEGAPLTETRVRPKLLTDLPPDLAKLIEDVQVDHRGRFVPRLYSKERANKELRNMLNLSAKTDATDVSKLSDQELIAQLARQARELNIEIDLSYSFGQQPPAAETDGQDTGQVIDHDSEADKR
jgi:hypothetical protein